MPSMCEVPECKNIDTLEKARACDAKVEAYCTSLALQKSSDPGCVNYVKEETKFAVPQVITDAHTVFEFQLFPRGLSLRKWPLLTSLCGFDIR